MGVLSLSRTGPPFLVALRVVETETYNFLTYQVFDSVLIREK